MKVLKKLTDRSFRYRAVYAALLIIMLIREAVRL